MWKPDEILGYMGDTGYGEEGNVTGKFPVHLHLGIYITTPGNNRVKCKSLLYFMCYGEKSKKVQILITTFLKYML